jgi:thioredoxin-like negative regulator of GroEL
MTCVRVGEVWENAYKKLKGSVKMGYVDVNTDRRIAYYYNIQQLPTIITIVGG